MKTLQASVEAMLIHMVKDLRNAEDELRLVLPHMWDSATNAELAAVLRGFLQHSTDHSAILCRIQETLGDTSEVKVWAGMDATIRESLHAINLETNPQSRDLVLLSGAQRIKGLKIAAYSSARSLAEARGWMEVAETLADILTTEMEGDLALVETAHGILHSTSSIIGD